MSLKQKTISALSWSACERFSQQGIHFIITIILARLLVPAEFGLIGMLTIFMAIAQSFVNSGFGQVGFLVPNLRANRTEGVSSMVEGRCCQRVGRRPVGGAFPLVCMVL
jgi:hypothetical protein